MTSATASLLGLSLARCTSAVSAMIPPSPLSSARMMKLTYLTDTMIVIDQNTSEITPYTSTCVTCTASLSAAKTAWTRVQRARADVAENDAERAQRERRHPRRSQGAMWSARLGLDILGRQLGRSGHKPNLSCGDFPRTACIRETARRTEQKKRTPSRPALSGGCRGAGRKLAVARREEPEPVASATYDGSRATHDGSRATYDG